LDNIGERRVKEPPLLLAAEIICLLRNEKVIFMAKNLLKVYNHTTTTELIIYDYHKNCPRINDALART